MRSPHITLWLEWLRCVSSLRPACSRGTTFLWMAVALLGFSARSERAGVTSFVRAAWLRPDCYRSLLHLFHTPALDLDRLTSLWIRLSLRLFRPLRVGGRLVLVADGLKVSKEGRKMPAVKMLHQESANNSKPEYIFGHSFQALGMLVCGPLGRACPGSAASMRGWSSAMPTSAPFSTNSSSSSSPSPRSWRIPCCSSPTPTTPAARSSCRCSRRDTTW